MVLAHDISKGDRTKDVKITQNITFETMLLAPDTINGLKDSGFQKPSPIQLYGIPIGKCGFDLLLEAKSGTGKTAVFAIIALEKLDFLKGLQAVILTPTREIAAQIYDVLKQIGSRYKKLAVEVVMGGLPLQDDIQKFKNPVHIVVGSPGRLRHLIVNNHIDTKAVRLLVLDEADKLMEKSFQQDIKYIHAALPKQKQVIMSSATYPESSKALINSYVQNASHVCPDSDSILLGIDQKVSFVKFNSNVIRHTQDRFKELQQILSKLQFKQCLVFCNYQARVTEVNTLLKKNEWPSQKLHGQQEQIDRLDALKTLQQYKCRILVSTDLAARGIDASNIDLVVNFEPPHDWQTYLHRIGRAGRFGSYGLAITILSKGKEEQKFKEMFKLMNLSINMRHMWSDEEFDINDSTTPKEQCNLSADNHKNNITLEKPNCNDIWELLSSKNSAWNCTETSKLQCDLKKNFEIEPFSELMLSLEDNCYQDNGDDIMFKRIEMFKTSDSNLICLDSQSIITNVKDVEELNNNKKDEDTHDNEPSKELIEVTSNAPINSSVNNNNSTTYVNKDDEQNDINNTPLSLELNTVVSSTSGKIHDVKRKINKKTDIKKIGYENKDNYKFNQVHNQKDLRFNKQEKLQKHFEISAINNNKDRLNPYIKRKVCYEQNGTVVDEHCDDYENFNYKEYYQQEKKNARSDLRKHTININMELKTRAKLYTDWYNLLKLRMRYIEQAIYINEMSKF